MGEPQVRASESWSATPTVPRKSSLSTWALAPTPRLSLPPPEPASAPSRKPCPQCGSGTAQTAFTRSFSSRTSAPSPCSRSSRRTAPVGPPKPMPAMTWSLRSIVTSVRAGRLGSGAALTTGGLEGTPAGGVSGWGAAGASAGGAGATSAGAGSFGGGSCPARQGADMANSTTARAPAALMAHSCFDPETRGRRPGFPGRARSGQLAHGAQDLGLAAGPDQASDLLAALEHDQRRDALDAQAGEGAGAAVRVELGDPHLPGQLRRELLDHGLHAAARHAPGRPHVEQHGQRRAQDLLVEAGLADLEHPRGSRRQPRPAAAAHGLQALPHLLRVHPVGGTAAPAPGRRSHGTSLAPIGRRRACDWRGNRVLLRFGP